MHISTGSRKEVAKAEYGLKQHCLHLQAPCGLQLWLLLPLGSCTFNMQNKNKKRNFLCPFCVLFLPRHVYLLKCAKKFASWHLSDARETSFTSARTFNMTNKNKTVRFFHIFLKLFSSFCITLSSNSEFVVWFWKTFLLSHHIGNENLDLMTCFQKKFRFSQLHSI